MLEDILSEAPLYKSLIARGKEEERERQLLSLRKSLLSILKKRFPQLSLKAQETLSTINQSEVLENLIVDVAIAQNEEEAKHYLLEAAQQKS